MRATRTSYNTNGWCGLVVVVVWFFFFQGFHSSRSSIHFRRTVGVVEAFLPITSRGGVGVGVLSKELWLQRQQRGGRLWSSPSSSSSGESSSSSSKNDKSTPPSLEQIRAWRERARQLYSEASQEEMALRKERQIKERDLDDFIQTQLFSEQKKEEEEEIVIVNVETLKEMSSPKIMAVWDRLLQRKKHHSQNNNNNNNNTSSSTTTTTTSSSSTFNIADSNNSKESREKESKLIERYMSQLLEAQMEIDKEQEAAGEKKKRPMAPQMVTKLKEWQRSEDVYVSRRRNSPFSSQRSQMKEEAVDFVRQTMGNNDDMEDLNNATTITIKLDGKRISTTMAQSQNVTQLVNDLLSIPMWVPPYLLSFLVTATSIELTQRKKTTTDDDNAAMDWKQVKNVLTQHPNFYCTGWDSIRLAAIYRGNFQPPLRTSSKEQQQQQQQQSVESIFHDLQSKVDEHPELKNHVQLFLVEDPEWRPGNSVSAKPDPVILALSKSIVPEQATERTLSQKVICGVSLALTVFTTFAYALSAYALNNELFDKLVNENDLLALNTVRGGVFFIMIGVALTSVVGEVAHWISAKIHKMKMGVGVPLPSLQIGTFGNITPLRSFPPSRSALLDFAISGPLVSLILSTVMVVWGLYLTIQTPADLLPGLATVPVSLMKSSLWIGSIVSVVAPKIMILPLSQPIPVHPLFFVGFSGLVASAVNLLPVGRLDGGRACSAVFGRRIAFLVSLSTLLFLAINSLSGNSTISIFWGLLVTLVQRSPEIPTRDEVTQVNSTRFRIYILSMLLSILILTPFPGGLGSL